MEGKLVKEEEGYYVFVNTVILGTTRPLLNLDFVKYKLSLDNCEKIGRDVVQNDLGEWDIEVCCYLGNGDKESDSFKDRFVTNTGIPKLDANGCLILKRK
jgi:hypothetical protein